jgi:DNA-binding response OmpR family regulator/predicted Ser/Thr protein kinase
MNQKGDILFINRDETLLKELGGSLRESGYPIKTAVDMREALSALSSNSVGLIVCDNTLKDVSGYDFLRFLKSDPLRDKIPFVFFVPLHDQGRPIEAFKLGAADFMVYPLKTDDFISRIKEIFPSPEPRKSKSPEPVEEEPTKPEGMPTEDQGREKRTNNRIYEIPLVRVEVSRNGILWMPAQIKNISRGGMFLETALLGKPGAELYVRASLPTGTTIAQGRIKHTHFKNSDPAAGIGVEMEDNDQWREILQFIAVMIRKGKSAAPPGNETPSPSDPARMINGATGEKKEIAMEAPRSNSSPQGKDPRSFDIRFYQSLIGKQLDNYKTVSFIGAGAMGGVFKGWDIALARPVALKVISYKLSAQETFRELFIKEARFISRLDHQNIAHVYYIGNVNQILYFAMEYIDGVTLAHMIGRGENLNSLKGLNYLVSICEALDFVRQKNIIHRDIKPANIMITDGGIIKIVDFGVARMLDMESDENNREGMVGSPLYISPDSILGLPLDHRSDIYSLGASFYHTFTGFPPFEGVNAKEVLLKHVEQPLPPLRRKNPKVSNALGKIIERMMAKKPEDRYQDYKDVIKDLKNLQTRALRFQKLRNATLIFKVRTGDRTA